MTERKPSVLDLYGSPEGNWVQVSRPEAETVVECLDGEWWHEAEKPMPRHRCRPQTRGLMMESRPYEYIERCACGAIRRGAQGVWWERNGRSGDTGPRPRSRLRLAGRIAFTGGMLGMIVFTGLQGNVVVSLALVLLVVLWFLAWVAE